MVRAIARVVKTHPLYKASVVNKKSAFVLSYNASENDLTIRRYVVSTNICSKHPRKVDNPIGAWIWECSRIILPSLKFVEPR